MSVGEQGEGPFLRLLSLSFCCCTAKQRDTLLKGGERKKEREKMSDWVALEQLQLSQSN